MSVDGIRDVATGSPELNSEDVPSSSQQDSNPTLADDDLELPHTPKKSSIEHATLHRTPSKVTINLRTPRPTDDKSAQPQDRLELSSAGGSDGIVSNVDEDKAVESIEAIASIEMSADSTGPSPTLSAEQSPEVTVVEDVDSDYNGGGWGQVVSVVGEDAVIDIMSEFPYSTHQRNLYDTVTLLESYIEKGEWIPSRSRRILD
jgi:hypothetical protein